MSPYSLQPEKYYEMIEKMTKEVVDVWYEGTGERLFGDNRAWLYGTLNQYFKANLFSKELLKD